MEYGNEQETLKMTGFTEGEIETIGAIKAVDAAKIMISIREELDGAKKVKTEFQKKYDWLRKALAKKMEDESIDKFTVDGKNITTRIELYVSIPKDQREEAWKWLVDNDMDIITETVNAMTLKATVKEQTEKGKNFPDDMFKITMEPQARFY